MTDGPDDLEKLVSDIRKSISDNNQFLEKLLDENIEEDEDEDTLPISNDFEEL